MKKKFTNQIILFVFIFLSIVYLELLFKLRVLSMAFNMDLLRILFFSLAYSIYIMFVVMFFKTKIVTIIMFILTFVITFLYFNQEIFYLFYDGFYSLAVAGAFKEGLSFLNDYVLSFKLFHIFYLAPLLSLYILWKYKIIKFEVEYITLKQPLIILLVGFLTFFITFQSIDEDTSEYADTVTYSDMDLYTYILNPQDALKKFGLLTYTQRDFFSLFRTDPLSEAEYKVLLDAFFENEGVREINNFSRIFSDKNFILILAESLDTFAINEELTPYLYDLKSNYTYFENYYSPLYYRSTADTEFMVQTSLYPDKNVTLTMEAYMNNTFPDTLPRMFSEKGYSTYSFHNYTDYFYNRTDFHTITLGYDEYYGSEELGMLDNPEDGELVFDHKWQSDLTMMELTIPKFIDDDKFFVNYTSVSGHFRYTDDHEIAQLHIGVVEQYEIDNNIVLPDEIKYYLATQIEFDKALGLLIDSLDAAGKLDDTVIMIYGDHYAYGIDKEVIWEYDTEDHKEDGSDMDIHNVPLIIRSDSFLLNGLMDEYMSSIDILPTVANLFGLSLNYSTIFGEDVFRKMPDDLQVTDINIVHFADMGFISEYFSYNSLTEDYIIVDEFCTPDDLIMLYHQIFNDYRYNNLALQYDYFAFD